ncbi:meiosis-specific kinetochore protein [Paroedura picta]|uniref:meiosis-specific kinetochore protein n=1 Tax=Paroedura picta TaxID=143630 RepID=UPI004055D0CC
MDWIKLRTYSGKRKARMNVHCASPVPGMVVPVGRRNAPRQCLNKLYKHQIENVNKKTLPAVQETSKVDCFSTEQSDNLNYNENTGMNMNENINEMDSCTSQDSLHLNSGSRESLGNNENSSEMTLPTGVSDFLLECLDSSIEADTEYGDGPNSFSSPEAFRDDSDLEGTCANLKEYFGCKNSTLLDTSKAINIDKIPPLPSFSKIFENSLEIQNEHLACDTLFKSKQCCESTDVSTTAPGKQVSKFLLSKEKTPKSKLPEILVLPRKGNRQLDDEQSKSTKFRKKVHFRSFLDSMATTSSSVALSSADLKTSDPSQGIIAGELAPKEPGACTLALSVQKAATNEKSSNTSLHFGETVPASPESSIFQYLQHPPEICCIIKASPEFRPLKVFQHPPSRQLLSPPPKVSTDIIASDRNWIYNNDR